MLAVAGFWKVFSAILFLLVCFLLIVVVLLQKGRGGGLSGAFGGAGGHSAFGAKTGDFFTWVTVCLAGLFLLIAIVNNYTYRKVTVETAAPPQPAQAPLGPGAPAGGEGGAGGQTPPAGETAEGKPATPPASELPTPAGGGPGGSSEK